VGRGRLSAKGVRASRRVRRGCGYEEQFEALFRRAVEELGTIAIRSTTRGLQQDAPFP